MPFSNNERMILGNGIFRQSQVLTNYHVLITKRNKCTFWWKNLMDARLSQIIKVNIKNNETK